MRYLATLFLFLLPACVPTSQAQIEPAVRSAAELRAGFEREQATNLALVTAANPQPATLEAYRLKQSENRAAFLAVFDAHVRHLASLGAVDPETVIRLMEAAAPLIR